MITKNKPCPKCQIETLHILELHVAQNGGEHFTWRCHQCKRLFQPKEGGGIWIPSETVRTSLSIAQIESLPVIMPAFFNRCARCGARDTELHHWAPRAMFAEDADKWPCDYLCIKCHAIWHQRVTPQLAK